MRTLPRRIPALALAVALCGGLVAPVLAEGPVTVNLAPTGPRGAPSGVATLVYEDGKVAVTVQAQGLAPNSDNPIYLHAGTCAQPSASFGNLGMLHTDSTGSGTLTASTMRVIPAGTDLPVTWAVLDGDHLLAIAGQTIMACGGIPKTAGTSSGTPQQLPRTGDTALSWAAVLAVGLGGLALAARRMAGRRRSG